MSRSAAVVAFFLMAAGACTCAPTNQTTGSEGILEVDRAKTGVDFGKIRLGDIKRVELTLFNRGRSRLKITSIERVSLAASFRIAQPPGEIAPDASAKLAVSFAPEEVGAAHGTLLIKTDSTELPEVSIALSGEGVETKIVITPEILDFGLVEVEARETRSITLRNDGVIAEDVQVTSLAENSPHFAVGPVPGDNNVIHLEPGSVADLPVAFNPHLADAAGFVSRVDFLPCPTCETASVSLKGTGVEAFLVVTPAELDFGLVNPGAHLEKKVTLHNVGTRALNVLDAKVQNGAGRFTFAGTFPAVLAPDGVLEIPVTYLPNGLTSDAGLLVVSTDDPKASSVQIALHGSGGGPDVTVSPAKLAFGTVAVGVPRTKALRVNNAGVSAGGGGSQLTITRAYLQGGAASEFSTDFTQPITIDVGRSAVLNVKYAPSAEGVDAETLVLETNDTDTPTLAVDLSGHGRALAPCQLSVVPASNTLAFGNVDRGRTATLPFALRNGGPDDCLIDGLALDPSSDAAFSLPAGPVAELALHAGDTLSLLVAFKPQDARAYSGKLAFNLSDPDHPVRELQLTGVSAKGCLLIAPNEVDFGTVGAQCASREKTINVYNTCGNATTVRLQGITLADSANPSFQLLGLPATFPVTLSGNNSLAFKLRYRPAQNGVDFGAVFLATDERPEPYNISLTGQATSDAVQHDLFHQDNRPKVDLLFIVDDSGSMSPYQAALAANFASFMKYANTQQVDYRIAVTTTDLLTSGERGRFVPVNGSRPRVLPPTTPNLAAVFADNLNFLRDDALLSVIAVTDEIDHSANTVDYYYNLFLNIKGARRANLFNFSAIAETTPGVYDYNLPLIELARRTGGIVSSIHTTNWAADLEKLGQVAFGYKTRFFLTSTPQDPSQIEVKLDSVVVPTHDGTITNWTFQSLENACDFSIVSIPEPGSNLEISYKVACGQ
jgi:hypothetical protein